MAMAHRFGLGGFHGQYLVSLSHMFGTGPQVFAPLDKNITLVRGLAGADHVREGDATYVDPDTGLVTTAGTDIPRFESVGGYRAILREPGGENVCLRSREFNHVATWVQTRTPNPTANETGIDGAANAAYTLTDNHAGELEYITQEIAIPDDANTHCVSIFIKKDTDTTRFPELQLRVTNGGDEQAHGVQINTETGEPADRVNDMMTDSYGVIDRGDWWQLWVNITNDTSGNVTLQIRIYPALGKTLGTMTVTTIGSIIIDAAQVELNKSFPSSFILTTTAAASRTTESGSLLWTLPTGLFDAQGTAIIWVRFGYPSSDDTGSHGILTTRNTGAASLLYVRATSDEIWSSDGPNIGKKGLAFAANTWYKFVVKWGYLDGAQKKFNVGVDTGSGISWGTEDNFAGSYGLGPDLNLRAA